MTTTDTLTQADPARSGAKPMIELVGLTKRFPGTAEAAVDGLTLTVDEGEITVLVGPSGCGKTTSMELINRLIEPTSGRILIDGKDMTHTNPDELRRHIGYVIQETGLLPHRTIAQNVGTVPKLLGWDKARIAARVDELLEMVGMDPATYRGRYPKELSGGQRQRVGVARALAADPPVMLMDEPFGAIDPITRERLQNEFLRLQQQVRKTIIFVTHDIDEALKMGDRIAVLRNQSHIAQYDTPENLLTSPADDYVSDFIGTGASLKRLNLSRVRDIEMATDAPTASVSAPVAEVRAALLASSWTSLLLLDAAGRPARWVTSRDLARADQGAVLAEVGLPVEAIVEPHATLADALDELIASNVGCTVVVDGSGAYQGIVDLETIMTVVRTVRDEYERFHLAQKLAQQPADGQAR
ncbi:betaine/proline/choline family ABC transporter ATP-binding protein [Promicromonospora iranensis]|uniref:Osmoprotectant transport system ATP-binding protein n=1 Tax=Promicromonospora iranensis TaxID=1105144 RepID=A0ABU2CSG7_9MICO|nr:betaine/proline/choline family ABC transporter ATP-binding protein [Promicromonospora iranensis]MDR7384107.1 osmoprotectant transport system ATP-binding protein [Promicromonospora iranensis]